MTVPANESASPTKKSNKTLIYALVGCGGCILLSVAGVVGLGVWGYIQAPKNEMASAQTIMTSFQAVALQTQLAAYLMEDETRTQRADGLFEDLHVAIEAGEVKSSEVEALNKDLEQYTKDNKLTGDEADAMLDKIEAVVK